jgi:murein DD-endopeptidase MepM/ murein hydrolase activator NlpD
LWGAFLPAHAQEYLWPTDSGTYLSATFGETRSAHFHAGLDIKTWGREGYRVFAARDGILYRLLVTERGYGNAIYLKHPDSTYTTYAHLQRFNPEFQALADSIRMKDHTFEMDSNFEHEAISVKQGDVIGYTGSSGIGPPHLHFEIRDSFDDPINALSADFPIKDDIPPVFSSLIVEPLTKGSKVNGRAVSYFTRSQKVENGYNFGTIEINGAVGLAVNVFDQANDVYNAYAVHQLTLMQEADTLFHEVLNSFQFEQEEEMFLDRIAPFGSEKRGHQRLYGKDGHNNPFYMIDREEAKLSATAEPATYTIIAKDYFGNISSAEVTIVNGTTPFNNSNDTKVSDWLPPEEWYWNENWFSPNHINTFNFDELNGLKLSPIHRLIQPESEHKNVLEFLRLRPDSSYISDSGDRDFRLRFKSNTFFDTVTIARSSFVDVDTSIVLSILPGNTPLKKGFIMEYFLGDHFETGKKYGFYRIDPDDKDLDYIDSRLRGKTLVGYPNEFGNFKIMADEEQPRLSGPRLVETDYGKWFVVVDAIDGQSGIDSSTAIFEVNGIRGIAEYDYEEEILRYYHPNFTPENENTISISVKDKAGNVVKLSDKITLPGQ